MIYVYNNTKEDHSNNPFNFYIGRPSILSNPYTDKPLKGTLAIYQVKNRDEAIKRYESYFDLQYSNNPSFKEAVDTIYEIYKSGNDVYLECFCKPLRCHGDVIKEKLQKRLIKEKIKETKTNLNAK